MFLYCFLISKLKKKKKISNLDVLILIAILIFADLDFLRNFIDRRFKKGFAVSGGKPYFGTEEKSSSSGNVKIEKRVLTARNL